VLYLCTGIIFPIVPADGSEEIETSGIFDTLIRGDVQVTLAKVGGGGDSLTCQMSRGMKFVAETHLESLDLQETKFDIIILPGGFGGAKTFAGCKKLIAALKQQIEAKRWYAAICASPAIVLEPNGLLPKKATCYPALHSKITHSIENEPSALRVVVDKDAKCVTSQGPGTTLEFGVALLVLLVGEKKAKEVEKALLLES